MGRRCCWGWAELLPGGACWPSELRSWSSPLPISQAFPCHPLSSCREAWGQVLREQGRAASEASPWARTCMEGWRPQILQLFTCSSPGAHRWLMALTEGTRKLLISSLQSSGSFAHPPGLIYRIVWPPYHQLRITACLSLSSKLPVWARCLHCQSSHTLLGRNPCVGSVFSLAKKGQEEGKNFLHLWAQIICSRG